MKRKVVNRIGNMFGMLCMSALLAASPAMADTDVKWELVNTSSTSSGLPSDEVISLRFDKKGTLWTSTNLAFANYGADEWYVYGAVDGLTWGETRMGRILLDSSDNVWVCSEEMGIAKIDAEGNLSVIDMDNGLMSNLVYDIVEDADGGYYISNWEQFGNTLSHVDKDGNWTHYGFSELGDNPFDQIFSLYYDKDNKVLYAGTLFSGVKKLQDGAFVNLSDDYQTAVSEMTSDGKGIIYAATDIGLLSIDTNNGDAMKLMTMADGLPDNFTTSVAVDACGNVWAGTDGYGVSKISDGIVEVYSTENGLTSNDIYTITFDADGNAWLGTHKGGICHQDGNGSWKHIGSTGLAGNDVNGILFDGDVTWYATGSGISRQEGELWKNFMFMNEDGSGLASNFVSSMLKDNREGKKSIFASGHGGVVRYNSMFEEWEYFKYQYTDEEGSVRYPKMKLFQMSDGDMWVTTFGENLGIAKFDDATGEFTFYNDKNTDAISKNCNSFFEAAEAPDGSVWFGSVDGALIYSDGEFRMEKFETQIEYEDPETGEIYYGYDNNVRKICFKEDGRIWIGKISGIIIYDPLTGEKTQELGNDDDPVALVTDFWFDADGNTFISTLLSGIYMRTKNGGYFHLGEEYGLDPQLMVYSMEERDGKLYICCDNGVMITKDHSAIVNDVLEKENTTAIGYATVNTGIRAVYDASGVRRATVTKGLNIIVDEDGSVKKVLVK